MTKAKTHPEGARAYHWERVANFIARQEGRRPPCRCRVPSRDKALWHMTVANAMTDQIGDGRYYTEREFKRWREAAPAAECRT